MLAGRLTDQFPSTRGQPVLEQPRPSAEEDRAQHDCQPFEPIGGQQRLDDARAGEHQEVTALGREQVGRQLGGRPVDDGRPLPQTPRREWRTARPSRRRSATGRTPAPSGGRSRRLSRSARSRETLSALTRPRGAVDAGSQSAVR